MLLEHIGGNYGLEGAFDDTPLEPETAWTIGLQPIAVQNNVAIATGRGVVRSRFPLSEEQTAKMPAKPYMPRPTFEVHIVTMLSRAGNFTLMRVQTTDGQPAEDLARFIRSTIRASCLSGLYGSRMANGYGYKFNFPAQRSGSAAGRCQWDEQSFIFLTPMTLPTLRLIAGLPVSYMAAMLR